MEIFYISLVLSTHAFKGAVIRFFAVLFNFLNFSIFTVPLNSVSEIFCNNLQLFLYIFLHLFTQNYLNYFHVDFQQNCKQI